MDYYGSKQNKKKKKTYAYCNSKLRQQHVTCFETVQVQPLLCKYDEIKDFYSHTCTSKYLMRQETPKKTLTYN